MPLITREETNGWITCGRSRPEHGHCEGYQSKPIRLIRETVTRTFGDAHEDRSDPYYALPSVAHEYLHTLDGSEPTCAVCGQPANLSLEPRPTYTRLSEKSPDELVLRRGRERAAAAAAQEQLAVGERQAAALEALAAGARPGEVDQLRELAARQSEQIERLLAHVNGDADSHVSRSAEEPERRARPRRKTP